VKSRRSLFLEVDSFHVNSLPNIRCHRSCRAIFHVDNRHTLAFLPLVRSILLRWNSGLVKVEALKTRYCQVRLARMMFDTLEIHGQLCYQNNTKRRERERERERDPEAMLGYSVPPGSQTNSLAHFIHHTIASVSN
jgi:hypothetical protein